MNVRRGDDGRFYLVDSEFIENSEVVVLSFSGERKKLLLAWARDQIDEINEKKMHSVVAAFFTYQVRPTSVGPEVRVICHCTDTFLDLSLLEDEDW